MSEIKAICDCCGEEVILYINKFKCKSCKDKSREVKSK